MESRKYIIIQYTLLCVVGSTADDLTIGTLQGKPIRRA